MKFSTEILLTFLLLAGTLSAYGDKILVVTFFSSKSHKLTYMSLIEKLGERGHNITVLSPIKPTKKMKNVNEILTVDWEVMEKTLMKEKGFDPFEMKAKNQNINPFLMLNWFTDLCEDSYDLPQVKAILKEEFDLIFVQPTFNDCVLGLVYRLKAPLLLFSPVSVAGFLAEKIGNHFPPSFNPNIFLGLPAEMSFFQRFKNFGFNLMFEAILKFYYEPAMEAVYRKKLGNDIPSVSEILANTSLVLSNGHFSLHKPKPFFPDIVDVGGIHSRPAKPLPKDLENFIEKGTDGFIFFSMGSAIQGSQMPEETRKMFLKVFSELKQQVIWKWETETMPDLPVNVKLTKWAPQQDLLGHNKIKMFMTHCGGGSTEEAIYHGVPLLGFPMFGDQPLNAKLARTHGFIVEMDWNDLTDAKLSSGIKEILNNPKYRDNVKNLSTLFKDQPDLPMDRAVYWVEYVMRHKGAPHLRNAGRKLNYFQYHSYDVILTYLALLSGSLYLVFVILRFIAKKTCCRSSRDAKKSKKE